MNATHFTRKIDIKRWEGRSIKRGRVKESVNHWWSELVTISSKLFDSIKENVQLIIDPPASVWTNRCLLFYFPIFIVHSIENVDQMTMMMMIMLMRAMTTAKKKKNNETEISQDVSGVYGFKWIRKTIDKCKFGVNVRTRFHAYFNYVIN